MLECCAGTTQSAGASVRGERRPSTEYRTVNGKINKRLLSFLLITFRDEIEGGAVKIFSFLLSRDFLFVFSEFVLLSGISLLGLLKGFIFSKHTIFFVANAEVLHLVRICNQPQLGQ